jgi:hypothetical protein
MPSFNVDKEFPERWLHGIDLEGKARTLTIKDVYPEDVRDPQSGKTERALVISFVETPREYLCNIQNRRVLRTLWGKMTGDWTGKRIVLEAVPSQVGPTGWRIVFTGSPDIDKPVTVQVGGHEAKRVIKPTKKAGSATDAAPGMDAAAFAAAKAKPAADGPSDGAIF